MRLDLGMSPDWVRLGNESRLGGDWGMSLDWVETEE